MIKYEDIKNLELIRTPIVLPRTTNNTGVNIILNTTNVDASVVELDIMKKQFIRYQNFNYYYYNFYYHEKYFNKPVMLKLGNDDLNLVWDKITANNKFITNTPKFINLIKKHNVIMDISKYNEIYFEKKLQTKVYGDKAIIEYMNLLIKTVDADINHDKKIMIIDLNSWNVQLKKSTTFMYTKADNPFSFIYCAIQRHIELINKLNCDIIFIDGIYKIKLIPAECTMDSFKILKAMVMKIREIKLKTETSEEQKESIINTKEVNINDKITNNIMDIVDIGPKLKVVSQGITGEVTVKTETESIKEELNDEVTKTVTEVASENSDATEDDIASKVEATLNNNKHFLAKLELLANDSFTGFASASSKRNQMLAKEQINKKINNEGKTINQILSNAKGKKLEPKIIKTNGLNTDMKINKLENFCKSYNENLMEADTIAIINFFKDKRIPVYILDIKKEDTSTNFDKKITYTVKMESADRERHTVVFDMPKFVDNSFMYLGGNKKVIINQFFLKPVSKTSPDTVQMCSNYNKIFIRRVGTRTSPKLERFKKCIALNNGLNMNSKLYYKSGNVGLANTGYLSNIDYDDLSNSITDIYVGKEFHFFFNQRKIRDFIKETGLSFKDDDSLLPIGIRNKKEVIYLDVQNDIIIGTKLDLISYLVETINNYVNTFKNDFKSVSVGKRYVYGEATLLQKKIPVLLLLMYMEGITTVLKKANINHYFSDTRPRLSDDEIGMKEVIQFADGYLTCDRYPTRNSLLINAFSVIPTKDFNYTDFDKKEVYISIFDTLYNDSKILNGFENFYDLFIDPITLEVLGDLNMPTDFVSLMIFANSLLEDNHYTKENDLSLYRLRNNEIVNGHLYKAISTAYANYRTTAGNKHPVKMSFPKDQILRDVQVSPIVEDYSTLSPFLEIEKNRAASFKGLSGLNQERAYTLEKRSYDKTMRGILAMSSPASGSVGIVRQMPLDVNILSPRGYYKLTENDDELNSANMFSPAELMTFGSAEHDDAQRVGMLSMQTKQIIPCDGYDELLITNDIDSVIPQIISNDFAFKAKEDGTVVEINEDTGIMVVQYKSGKYDTLDLYCRIVKNGASGSYLNNKLETTFKVGSKFKKEDILANNTKFINNKKGEALAKNGALVKIALTSGYFNYEDSVMITKKLSKKLESNVTMKKDEVIGKNSNIDFIVERGAHVEVGDPILIYDESFEDDSINKVLGNMGKSMKDKLISISKRPVKSPYAGVVEDIRIYYTIDTSEMSDSVKNVIKKINKHNIERQKNITKYMKLSDSEIEITPIDKVESKYGKIKGVDVGDGILIEFYISHDVAMGIGDKLTFYTALKGVTCKVCEEGYEPYSEFRPDEEISAFLSPISELARMTKSLDINLFGNKVLIEGKRAIAKIIEDNDK